MKTILALFLSFPTFGYTQVSFTDVARANNIRWQGKSFGSSWADVTGNGYPDLFMQCHANAFDPYFNDDLPRYYFNTGEIFIEQPLIDAIDEDDWHGGVMFDFDNDGDLDHLSVTGGSSGNVFFVNQNGDFNYVNQAFQYSIVNDRGVGRTPTLIDADNDGFLDVLLNNLDGGLPERGPRLFLNLGGQGFKDGSTEYNLDWPNSVFSVSADLIGDSSLHVVYLQNRIRIASLDNGQFADMMELPAARASDFAVADFNGNLLPDIFCAVGQRPNVVEQIHDDLVRGFIAIRAQDGLIETKFSSGSESIKLRLFGRTINSKYLVSLGSEDANIFVGEEAAFDLNSSQNRYRAIPAIVDTLSMIHVYIGFDEVDNLWHLRLKSGANAREVVAVEISGSQIELLSKSGFVNQALKDVLYINNGNMEFTPLLQDVFDPTDNSTSVIWADFDNDMDLDLYVVVSSTAMNKKNILYENVDNQYFVRHEGAWGATGDGPGIGESANSVDFNNDGFMDIYVNNGSNVFFLDSARTNLYQNNGNDNNWIKIVLKGIISNPLGLHAKVFVYAGGIAQMRYQDGGFHRYCQNDSRLHFGLAQHRSVDSIVVQWPSGIRQKLIDLNANQILTIKEEQTRPPVIFTPSIVNKIYLRIYPNPASSHVTISIPGGTVFEVRLYDATGRKVQENHNDNNDYLFYIPLQVGEGIFIAEIVTSQGVFTKKIIVL